MNLDKIIDIVRKHKLNEMMTVGAGGIAGTVEAGDDPPVRKKKKKTPPVVASKAPVAMTDEVTVMSRVVAQIAISRDRYLSSSLRTSVTRFQKLDS